MPKQYWSYSRNSTLIRAEITLTCSAHILLGNFLYDNLWPHKIYTWMNGIRIVPESTEDHFKQKTNSILQDHDITLTATVYMFAFKRQRAGVHAALLCTTTSYHCMYLWFAHLLAWKCVNVCMCPHACIHEGFRRRYDAYHLYVYVPKT